MTSRKRNDVVLKEDGHQCDLESDYEAFGAAIHDCYEATDGTLWAGNCEYGSQVNFCPTCGYEAPTKVIQILPRTNR